MGCCKSSCSTAPSSPICQNCRNTTNKDAIINSRAQKIQTLMSTSPTVAGVQTHILTRIGWQVSNCNQMNTALNIRSWSSCWSFHSFPLLYDVLHQTYSRPLAEIKPVQIRHPQELVQRVIKTSYFLSFRSNTSSVAWWVNKLWKSIPPPSEHDYLSALS